MSCEFFSIHFLLTNSALIIESIHQSSIYIPSRDKLTNTSSKKVLGCTKTHVLLSLAIAKNTIAMATTRSMPLF